MTDSSNLWDKLVSLVTICYKEENDFNGEFASVQSFVSTHLFLCTFISFKVQGDCWGKAEGSGVLPIYMWLGKGWGEWSSAYLYVVGERLRGDEFCLSICGWGKVEGREVLPKYVTCIYICS